MIRLGHSSPAANRDPALYKTRVLMCNGKPLVPEDALPEPRFPKEATEAEKRVAGLFNARGNVTSTVPTDYDTRAGHNRNQNHARVKARLLAGARKVDDSAQ